MIVRKTGVDFEPLDNCSLCVKENCKTREEMKMKIGFRIIIMECPEMETDNGKK